MKKISPYLFLLVCVLFISCGSDDEYSPTDTADTEAPAAPRNLMTTNTSETSVTLTWDAATDNVGVTGYKLFQDGLEINSNISSTSFLVDGLTENNAYNFYVSAFDAAGNESPVSTSIDAMTLAFPLEFKTNLSEMSVFEGELKQLIPASGVQLYEINSTLFTDYAVKQRLIKLPFGGKMTYNGDDLLPSYPDETLIAKTFYYNIDDRDPSLGKKVIETRIFLKINGVWEVGDYVWNDAQTDATYTEDGSEKNISYIDIDGNTRDVEYLIPSKDECFTCHNNSSTTFPIGMKLRSMNFTPSYIAQNQLDFFIQNGLLEGIGSSSGISVLVDWKDTSLDINDRGRAYIDINCAHCHQPNSTLPATYNMDFRLETPYADTELYNKRFSIRARTSVNTPGYRMPALGRTVVHTEAYAMLEEYLDQLVAPNP